MERLGDRVGLSGHRVKRHATETDGKRGTPVSSDFSAFSVLICL